MVNNTSKANKFEKQFSILLLIKKVSILVRGKLLVDGVSIALFKRCDTNLSRKINVKRRRCYEKGKGPLNKAIIRTCFNM